MASGLNVFKLKTLYINSKIFQLDILEIHGSQCLYSFQIERHDIYYD